MNIAVEEIVSHTYKEAYKLFERPTCAVVYLPGW